jgi:hypothetical protein
MHMNEHHPRPDPPEAESLSELLRIGKDEMNLAEFPMTSLSDKPAAGETSLKFEDQIYDERKRKLIPRKRIIEGSKEYGLPTATDDSVILALIQLTKLKNGFACREVEFTRHELISLLSWPNKGQSYDRISQSLHRVAGVTYHFENSWWDNRRKAWTTKIFGIIDNVELNDSRETDTQGALFTSRITWNQIILDSFQAGYLRSLDFQLAMSLKHATSMRIYRFMGKRFHLRSEWSFDLKDFAYEHIGLSRNYEGGAQIARKLQPAISELENVGFLEEFPENERFLKNGREWSIRLVQKQPFTDVMSPALPCGESEPEPLVTELVDRGVTKATAEEIVQKLPAESIETKLEVFDWLVEKQDKRVAKSPAGYLVKSIQDDYATPKGFLSKAERQQREESKREADRRATENRHRVRQEEQRREEEHQAADAYLKRLNPAERAKLEAEVLAQADSEAKETYRDPTLRMFRDTLMLNMLREYLARKRKLVAARA